MRPTKAVRGQAAEVSEEAKKGAGLTIKLQQQARSQDKQMEVSIQRRNRAFPALSQLVGEAEAKDPGRAKVVLYWRRKPTNKAKICSPRKSQRLTMMKLTRMMESKSAFFALKGRHGEL